MAGPRAELPVPARPPEHPRPAVHGQESGRPVRRVQRVPRPRYRSYEPVAKTILDTLTKPAESNSGEPNAAHPETSRIVFPLPEGTDYAAPDGTPIYTVADRIVELAEYSESWGGHIVIDHTVDSHAISTGYIHMWASGIYVTVGQRVTARQHIGDVGSSGQSTGPHLYFEVRPGGGQAIDGDAWLTAHGAPVRAAKPTWSTRA
ncbi:M23 family metallopeptidase [Bifidobacterium psychraerophilum]|uniref:M23 family metallopeptidase n=1 Tax=Bifidobacterium psychraerophilum TaxID=218140 RepID=UPI0019308CFD|nr:M23 family metallopeptidase [Bifidobacterium psychraerophilum]